MAFDPMAVRERLAEKSVNSNYSGFRAAGGVLALVGIALFLFGLSGTDSHRTWHAFQVNWIYWTGVCAGSIAFTAVSKISGAKWSGVILRLSQAASAFIPVSVIGAVLVMTVGYTSIYGNMNAALGGVSHGKALWLSHSWMAVRLIGGLGVLYFIGWKLIKSDMLPDLALVKDKVNDKRRALFERLLQGYDEGANHTRIYKLAAIFAVTYAIVMTMVAFDGMMALQPHWFSNLLGGWYFMGSWLCGLMMLAIMTLIARKNAGLDEFISPKQRHDLGKLCFGFTVFWTYLLWAQFLVIWYGNLPEEIGFVFARLWGPWRPIGAAIFLMVFLLPFGGLMGVAPKKSPVTLGLFATISLCGIWLERYLMITPSVTALPGPMFGLAELGPTMAFLGLFIWCYGMFAKTYPMVSPRLAVIALEREAGH